MSFQAGAFYFDRRIVPDREVQSTLEDLATGDCAAPTSQRYPGVFLVHSDSQLRGRAVDGIQPYVTNAGSITFDGRLDNREDLLIRFRDVLGGQTSDPALALSVYEQSGPGNLTHLIGDWSLVIWDVKREMIVLASDFAGVRPLYYYVQAGCVVWSTSLKTLVHWAQADDFDDEYVGGFLAFGGCPNRTPFRGIYSVPPGQSVLVSRDGIKVCPFFQLPVGNTINYQRESEYEEHLRALFREAVRCRLSTDGPVLSELSGGLDSSSVVCMASHLIRSGEAEAPKLVSLSFEREGTLDKRFWTAVEEWSQVDNIHESTAPNQFLTDACPGDTQPLFWEQLHTRTAALSRQVGAKTYLTGQLGDLIMGNWADDSDQVAGLLRQGRIGSAMKHALDWSKVLRIPISWVLGRALLLTLPPWLTRSDNWSLADGTYKRNSPEDSIAPRFRQRIGLSEMNRFFSQNWTQAPPERRKHFRGLTEILELRTLQPPEPLEHLYYTHAFVHRPLVTFMLSIPANIVCRAGEPRRLMRKALRELWPPELRKRRSKDSFSGVFLDSLRPLAGKMLKGPQRLQVVERGYVDPENLKKRLDLLSNSLECNEPQLRRIILLEFWLRARENRLRTELLSA